MLFGLGCEFCIWVLVNSFKVFHLIGGSIEGYISILLSEYALNMNKDLECQMWSRKALLLQLFFFFVEFVYNIVRHIF